MEILLIRHGDPDYANDTLTPRGHEEARRLARFLAARRIDAIYQSPKGRARATCAYTVEATGMQPVTLDWLEEVGIKRGELYLWNAPGPLFLGGPSLPAFEGCLEPGGVMPEGRTQFDRVSRGFDDVMDRYGYVKSGHLYLAGSNGDKTLAFFCHHGVIVTLLSYLLHWPLPLVFVHTTIDPTGVTVLKMVEHDGRAHPKLLSLNCLAHLVEGRLR
jgi:broad specificity phosphatase PhoE